MKYKLRQLGAFLLLGSLLSGVSNLVMAAEDEAESAFKKAMEARESGDIIGSIEIFETILSQEPSLHRARLELAVAYYRSVQYAEAERQAKKVLDDPKTPQSVRLSIIAFLAQIKADRKRFASVRHGFRPSITVGYLHDTNVNVGPSSDAVNIGTATLRLVPGSTAQTDEAFTATVRLHHSFQTGKVVDIAGKSAAILWQSQVAIYTRQYEELTEFNLDVVSLSTGPAFIVPRHWRGTISLRLDNIELGSDRLALYATILPSITWQLNNTTDLTINATLADRDFKQTADEGRDNHYKAVGVSIGKRYMADKVSLQAGLTLFDEDAENDRFSRDGIQVFAGVNWKAWENGSVYASFSQRKYKHEDREPLFNVRRDEREERYVLGARHEFKNGYLQKWVLEGNYSNTENASNVDIFDFDREVISATFSRSF